MKDKLMESRHMYKSEPSFIVMEGRSGLGEWIYKANTDQFDNFHFAFVKGIASNIVHEEKPALCINNPFEICTKICVVPSNKHVPSQNNQVQE